jgi:hypothetical protein
MYTSSTPVPRRDGYPGLSPLWLFPPEQSFEQRPRPAECVPSLGSARPMASQCPQQGECGTNMQQKKVWGCCSKDLRGNRLNAAAEQPIFPAAEG